MAKHQYLLTVQKRFKKQGYFTLFPDDNVLELSETKQDNPFAYLVIEEGNFDGIILCLNVGYTNIFNVANITVGLMHIAPVAMGDPFYIASDGTSYWNEEAFTQAEIESNEFLKKIKPVSKELH